VGGGYEDERLARAYQPGNEMPEAALRAWTELICSYGPCSASAVLDVGAGTGIFSHSVARRLQRSVVVGIDPSKPMLAEARRRIAHPRVRYVAGTAEALPIRSGVFDLAILSRVIHHLPDPRACALELRRVLRPDGVVVIRTTFREGLDALVYDYWPSLRVADRRRFPSQQEVVDHFTAAGFAVRDSTSFAQPVTTSLGEFHARMSTRPQSKFTQLTDHEFAEGMTRLGADAEASDSATPRPVLERYDLLVMSAG